MISAIIPAWCEAAAIVDAVNEARAIADEVIVADAGSPDGTGALARAAGAHLVSCARGRGAQLVAGAAAARGDVLLFLHADARLPRSARAAIDRALGDPSIGGGNFRLRFEPADRWARLFTYINHERRRLLRIYYGDSGVFVRRRVYERIGGFRALPIMEDYDLVRRLERATRTAYITDVEIVASSRRFIERPVRTLAVWAAIQTLASAGVAPERLARLYADIR
ncbi:MAG: TIGR04283 family arsenosugar biosynthesis glycosyltransferase [Deltaproteobacteria bacterium]|nr:TIGR04283 family arsenosugar biosynthesis glycosyltransferase [Deltaproteobacteria bacterium]